MIIAHRGGRPENTVNAFNKCVLNDIDGLEFDVHLTLDQYIVVTHDYIIDDKLVSSMNLADIKKIDPDVPTLEQVLYGIYETASKHQKAIPIINIEIKPWGITDRLAHFIRCYVHYNTVAKLSHFVFTSFLHTEVLKLKQQMPSCKLGFIYRSWPTNIIRDTHEHSVDVIVISEYAVNNNQLVDFKKNSLCKVWVYTVNDDKKATRLLTGDSSIDAVITDVPYEMKNKIVSLK